MTEKTLGQVLYEALPWRSRLWADLFSAEQKAYETEAQAVAAVVREQVAAWIEPQRNDVPATGAEFAAALRSMNP